MKKELLATAMGTALVALGALPSHALEFDRRGGATSGLFPVGALNLRAMAGLPEARRQVTPLDKKQVENINKGKVSLPHCVRPEGSLRIVEPDDGQSLWASYGLPMPTRMLRSFVTESSCWTVLDRGVGFAAAQAERELASGGHLQSGSNLGGGQMLAADYILIPDIVSQNANAGGRNFGAGGSGSVGGLGRLMLGGGGSSQQKTVSVMLTLVDSRTSEVLATATGSAEVSDRQWQVMASGSGTNGVASGQGNISAGAYENTEIGTVTRAAYHQAFNQMLFDLEPMDLRARIQAAPEATRQQQPAQATAYGTGGSPTMTTSSAPAQMQLDEHAAHAQIRTQQIQQLHQMHQPQQPSQQMQYQQPQQMQQQMQYQQPQQMPQQQMQYQPQQQMQYQQPEQAMQGNLGQALVQGAVQQVAGQMLPAGTAQMAGQVMQGAQQGNLGQALVQGAVQQVAGQMLPAGAAQLAGQVMQGAQQGNLGQALVQGAVQQVAGQMLPAGTAQMAGQVMQGVQQGNLGQVAQQFAAQTLAPVTQTASGVLILKVPANFLADASGNNITRVLQPGESVARLAFSAQGDMLQVRDSKGVIGWIAANTIADVINVN